MNSEFFKVQAKPFQKDALVSSTSLCFWWDIQCSSASASEDFPGTIQQTLGVHWHTSRVDQEASKPYSFPPLLYSLSFIFPYLYFCLVWFFPVLSHFHFLSSALAREACKVMQAWIICSNSVFAVCRNLRNLQWNTRMPIQPGPKCTLELRDASIQRQWKEHWTDKEEVDGNVFLYTSSAPLLHRLFLHRQTSGFTPKWDRDTGR